MACRYILHFSHLEEFEDYLVDRGWHIEPTKGIYEVLRARKTGRQFPLIIYKKASAKEHLTYMDRDHDVVIDFLRSRRERHEIEI